MELRDCSWSVNIVEMTEIDLGVINNCLELRYATPAKLDRTLVYPLFAGQARSGQVSQ